MEMLALLIYSRDTVMPNILQCMKKHLSSLSSGSSGVETDVVVASV